MPDRFYLALLMLVLTGLALAGIAGHHAWTGPELIEVSGGHGLNLGDLPVLAAWAAGLFACQRLWRRRAD